MATMITAIKMEMASIKNEVAIVGLVVPSKVRVSGEGVDVT